MLRIQLLDMQDGTATLAVEGRVVGPWVEELRRSTERALAAGAKITVDLNAVSFVDRSGVELLLSLRSRDVALANCSPFLVEQLRG